MLPIELTQLELEEFSFAGTQILENADPAFQEWLDDIAPVESTGMTNVSVADVALPATFALHQNYPNPFNPSTQFVFDLPEAAPVKLTLYNAYGQRVAVIADGDYTAGSHRLQWRAEGLASGVYFYRIEAGRHTASRKLMLLK